tara:strand:+ start:1962 stop:2282 length:321 start_codon:yes stop_codon:yes gene_type:complete
MPENWIKVIKVNELEDEEAKEIEIENGFKIAIFYVNGNFFATDHLCTHEDASLCDGYIDGDTVECPLHQGVFSISSGKALESPATVDLKTYETKILDDYVYVNYIN